MIVIDKVLYKRKIMVKTKIGTILTLKSLEFIR